MSDRLDAAQEIAEGAAEGTAAGGGAAVATTTPPEPVEPASGPESGLTGDDERGKLRREAAGYRTKLREREALHERAVARLDRQDRIAVESIAAERMREGSDLWVGGADLDAMRGDDGELDDAKVRSEIDRVLRERPHWSRAVPDFAGGARPPAAEKPGFGAALKRIASGG